MIPLFVEMDDHNNPTLSVTEMLQNIYRIDY